MSIKIFAGSPIKALAKVPVLLLMTACTMLAQQAKTVQKRAAPEGTLSGRIFLVTRGGDVKPAILADIHLFFVDSILPAPAPAPAGGMVIDNTPGVEFGEKVAVGMEAETKRIKEGYRPSERVECLADMIIYADAIGWAMKSVPEKELWQDVMGQTDENGNFKLSVPRQGLYYLVVRGQAGAYDAVWTQVDVSILTGKSTELKLGSPTQACFKDE